jgi:hypothetical protein
MRARLAAVLLAALLLAGCGGGDVEDAARERLERARESIRTQVEDARAEYEERRERYGRRFREILAGLEQVVPRAERTSPTVRSRGRNEPTTIDAFLTEVLQDIDRYWTRTFEAGGLPEPVVRYQWVPPGDVVLSGCGQPAGDDAAFYCPADDTIYVAQRFAADLYEGVARGLPGSRRASGAPWATSRSPTCSPTSTRTTSSRSWGSSTTG